MAAGSEEDLYSRIIAHVFNDKFTPGATRISFSRDDLEAAAASLGVDRPKNLGDVVYSFRYRRRLPQRVRSMAPDGMEWIIVGEGTALYAFKAVGESRIRPQSDLDPVALPDATPEIIRLFSLGDEQALLARLRWNRLIDLFLGITAYSLQNHLRTAVPGIGQIEIDELYVGFDREGTQFVIPVQAKGGADELGVVQAQQDALFCRHRFPTLSCRLVAAQFLRDHTIVLFEVEVDLEDESVSVVRERQYLLREAAFFEGSD